MIFREADLEDASAIALVDVDSWRTTYIDIIPADYLNNLSYQKRESNIGTIEGQKIAQKQITIAGVKLNEIAYA